jgi:hypothetical protein
MHKIRGYTAYSDGGKACASGLPRSTRVYTNDKYLRKYWLDGWDATRAFRRQNLKTRAAQHDQHRETAGADNAQW